jgi:hypothetical protein
VWRGAEDSMSWFTTNEYTGDVRACRSSSSHRKEPLFFFDKTHQIDQSLDLIPPPLRAAGPARGAGVAHLPQL